MSDEFVGRYVLTAKGAVEPDEDGKAILRKVQGMQLLLGNRLGPGGAPPLYVDPSANTYWEFLEFEDGQIVLRRISRKHIEDNWPSVDLDHPIVVPRPVRY